MFFCQKLEISDGLETEGSDCNSLVIIKIISLIQSFYFAIKNISHFHPQGLYFLYNILSNNIKLQIQPEIHSIDSIIALPSKLQ